ncbi:MAG: hypothetical protein WAU07_04090 [Microgenomates group bacterium]
MNETDDVAIQEMEREQVLDLSSILVPFPETYAISRLSDAEYDAERAGRVRNFFQTNSDLSPLSSMPFNVSNYQESKIDEYKWKVENGELSKQLGQKLVAKLGLFFAGVKRPQALIDAILQHSGCQHYAYHSSNKYTFNEVIGIDYQEISQVGKQIREQFPDLEAHEVVRAASDLGLTLRADIAVSNLPDSFQEFVRKHAKGELQKGVEVIRQCKWLSHCWLGGSQDKAELAIRIQTVLHPESISQAQKQRLDYQDVIYRTFTYSMEQLGDVLMYDQFPDLMLVGQEALMITDDVTKIKKLLKAMNDYPDLLVQIAYRLRNRYRFADRSFEATLLEYTESNYLRIESLMQSMEQSTEERSTAQSAIAKTLSLESISDVSIVAQIEEGIRGIVIEELDMISKAAIITLYAEGNFSLSNYKKSSNPNINILKQAGNAIDSLGGGINYSVSDQYAITSRREEMLDRMLMRALFTLPDGSFDVSLFKYLVINYRNDDVVRYLDVNFVDTVAEPDKNVANLFLRHQSIISYQLTEYIFAHFDSVAQDLTPQGQITVNFVLQYFADKFTHNDSVLDVAQLIDAAGILPGFTEYCARIRQNLMKESNYDVHLASHYGALVKLFQTAPNDIESAILDFWRVRDERVLVASLTKSGLVKLVGDERSNRFLSALPKATQERRNAFMHNPYDRTSRWLLTIINETQRYQKEILEKYDLKFEFPEDIDCATEFIGYFGLSKNDYLFTIFRSIYKKQKNPDYELAPFITEYGITSVEELIEQYRSIEKKLVSHEPLLNLSQFTKFQTMLLGTVTGVDTHKFARGESIASLRDTFMAKLENGKIAPTTPEHQVAELEIQNIELRYTPSPAVQTRYEEVFATVGELLQSDNSHASWQQLRDTMSANVSEALQSMKADNRPRAQDFEQQIKVLETYRELASSIDSADRLLIAITPLSRINSLEKTWHTLVEKLVLQRLMASNLIGPKFENLITNEQITPESLLLLTHAFDELIKHHIIDFVSQRSESFWTADVINFFRDGGNKNLRKKVQEVFASTVNKFKADINRFETIKQQGMRQLTAIPDRGFLGQLSGYIANACYTAEKNILDDWSVTPYRLVDETKQPAELIGNFLLFDVQLASGESAILLRALNIPEEHGYDIPIICEKIIDMASEVAKKKGATQVLIPGLKGAISNYGRTLLHMEMNYLLGKLPVSLATPFQFNGYDLTHNCFVARTIPRH